MTTTRATAPAASRASPVEPGELAALREIVRLGTTAPTWDELMQLIVDRSTVAMSCSRSA